MHTNVDNKNAKGILYQLETDFHLSAIDKLCVGLGSYGYAPIKFGSFLNFAFGTAYDFYVSPYCVEGSTCSDIYYLESVTICLVNTPEGILVKNFDKETGEACLNQEFMRNLTKKHGYLALDRFEVTVLGNLEKKLQALDSSEWGPRTTGEKINIL